MKIDEFDIAERSDTFTELIRSGVPTQNMCICRENFITDEERQIILAAIKEEQELFKKLERVFKYE